MSNMTLNLCIWRQERREERGQFVKYQVTDIPEHMSFMEMLDVLNEQLIKEGKEPAIEFDNDCREGICGACGLVIDGVPHGPQHGVTTCQVHMRKFSDGQTIVIEPFRAAAFPVIKDLVIDRSSLDRIMQAGGFISINTGSAHDANALPIGKVKADEAFDAATCVGCGACVAACPNASASLFTAAKISQLALLPQGQPERADRARRMVTQMDKEGFGDCSNHGECEAACPKNISISFIARMKREYLRAMVVK